MFTLVQTQRNDNGWWNVHTEFDTLQEAFQAVTSSDDEVWDADGNVITFSQSTQQ